MGRNGRAERPEPSPAPTPAGARPVNPEEGIDTVSAPPIAADGRTGAVARRLAVAAAVLLVAACGKEVLPDDDHGPGRSADDATEVVLLGTSHFAGSATDEHTSRVADVLSDRRQRELDRVADRLAEWGPDRFFVECTPDRQSGLDSMYAAYRSGEYDPTTESDRNEIRQLGFRAADRSGVERLGCVDAGGVWLGARARQVAEEHNPEVLEGLERHTEERLDTEAFLADHTLGEYLVELNSEERLWENHAAYVYYFARMGSFDGTGTEERREGDLDGAAFYLADDVPASIRERVREAVHQMNGRVVDRPGPDTDYVVLADREAAASEADPDAGADTLDLRELDDLSQRHAEMWVGFPAHHVGADLVGEWYKRNLRIYANLWRAVDEEDDRVVLLMGQGHVWTLRTFLRENPDFEVVPVGEVL